MFPPNSAILLCETVPQFSSFFPAFQYVIIFTVRLQFYCQKKFQNILMAIDNTLVIGTSPPHRGHINFKTTKTWGIGPWSNMRRWWIQMPEVLIYHLPNFKVIYRYEKKIKYWGKGVLQELMRENLINSPVCFSVKPSSHTKYGPVFWYSHVGLPFKFWVMSTRHTKQFWWTSNCSNPWFMTEDGIVFFYGAYFGIFLPVV